VNTKIKIIGNDEAGYELRTERGFVLGPRLWTILPQDGKEFPDIPEKPFRTKLEASKAQLDLNLYLMWVYKNRTKTKSRLSE